MDGRESGLYFFAATHTLAHARTHVTIYAHQVVHDPRFRVLESRDRKAAFALFAKNRPKEEMEAKAAIRRQSVAAFDALLKVGKGVLAIGGG